MSQQDGRTKQQEGQRPGIRPAELGLLAERNRSSEPDARTARSDEARLQAAQRGVLADRARAQLDLKVARAAGIALEHRGGPLGDDAKQYAALNRQILDLDAERRSLEELEREARARVGNVIDPYGDAASPFSYFMDCLAYQGDDLALSQVQPGFEERLDASRRILADHAYRNTSYWQRTQAQYLAQYRQQNVAEQRHATERARREFRAAVTTGGGATSSAAGGGVAVFVLPVFLEGMLSVYRSPRRVVADCLNRSVPLPEYGMNVAIPQFTAAPGASQTTEGSTLTNTLNANPTQYLNGGVLFKGGQIQVTQAGIDRSGGPGMMGFDAAACRALADAMGAQVDLVCIDALLEDAQAVTDDGSFALVGTSGVSASFASDLKAAKSLTTDTAGVRIRSSHLFTTSDFADFIQAYGDAQGRLAFSPELSDSDPLSEGWTGYTIAGLRHYADDNIPAAGSNTQLIVTRPEYTYLLEGAPMFNLFPQFQADSLSPTITIHQYMACVRLYPTGVSVISGDAFASSTFA